MKIQRLHRAPVAQLDRASAFEAEGREFESLRARHSNSFPTLDLRCFHRINLHCDL
jgi:hypothetical protein